MTGKLLWYGTSILKMLHEWKKVWKVLQQTVGSVYLWEGGLGKLLLYAFHLFMLFDFFVTSMRIFMETFKSKCNMHTEMCTNHKYTAGQIRTQEEHPWTQH